MKTMGKIPHPQPTCPTTNVAALLEATGLLMPPGMVVVATIGHDSACPCVDGTAALTRCLCEHVNVTIEMQATR
jgi:hypothetical protein